MSNPKSEYDIIIVGGGLNGLATGAYLQKAGLSVAIFERRDESGTFCATEEVLFPGVKLNMHASLLVTHFGPAMVDLELEKFGLELCKPPGAEYGYFYPFLDGNAAMFGWYDVRKTYEMWKRISPKDAEIYRKITNFLAPFQDDLLQQALCSKHTDESFLQFLEQFSDVPVFPKDWLWMTGFEFVDSLFEHEQIKVGVLSSAAMAADDLKSRLAGPISILVTLCGFTSSFYTARGGSHDVVHSLVRCFVTHGGKIFYNCPVDKIVIEDKQAKGVVLSSLSCYPDTAFTATKAVISDLSAQTTFFDMVGEEHLSASVRASLKRYDYRGGTLFTNYYVMNERPNFACAEKFPEANNTFSFNFGAETVDEATTLFDHCDVRGILPDPPVAWGGCANYCIADPTQAPPGMFTVMSWCFVPYKLNSLGGPRAWDDIRESYADKVEEVLVQYLPNLKTAKVGRYVNTPHDYVRRNPHSFGNMHPSGATTESQMWSWKPFAGCDAPRTPIDSLYICQSLATSNFTHLGSAYVAACEVVGDLGMTRPDWWQAKAMDGAKELWRREGVERRISVD
ncbi:MAG: NAD(P)/FAD-dependent oxidoreductase [Porticoccaceae bacterium]|nr:NAD(P)/FAD-dependent oxidoreductase [Porticoccaceae bacterium]